MVCMYYFIEKDMSTILQKNVVRNKYCRIENYDS